MKVLKSFFSMPSMAFQLLIFAIAIGLATFVEDIYGTVAAKAIIYNAWWFELLILMLGISLIYNMIRFNLFSWQKLPVLLFHLSFIIIFLGSAFTRYTGIDGNLHVREQESTGFITSSDIYFRTLFHEDDSYAIHEELVRLTPLSPGNLNTKVKYSDKRFSFSSVDYIQNSIPVFTDFEGGEPAVDLLVSYPGYKKNLVLLNNEINKVNKLKIGLSTKLSSGIRLKIIDDSLYCLSDKPVVKHSMTGNDSVVYNANEWALINAEVLYQYDEYKFVIRDFYSSIELSFVEGSDEGMSTEDIVLLNVESKFQTKTLFFPFSTDNSGYSRIVDLDNQLIELNFGPRLIDLPFNIFLEDFVVHRYPGSNSPSSFDSYVSVLDKDYIKLLDYHIYMNHILNFSGWRFFQNSFDDDEKGSILSVTYDKWGVIVTYIGYFLLTLGMLLSLFWRKTQFRSLLGLLNKNKVATSVIFFTFLSISGSEVIAQTNTQNDDFKKEVYSELNKVWLLDKGGRFKPLNTIFYEVARKIYGKGSIDGVPAEIAIPDLVFFPEKWFERKIIKVKHDEVKDILGVTGKFASISDFFDKTENGLDYRLYEFVENAYKTAPSERSKLLNEIIAVDERLNILLMVQAGDLFQIFPNPSNSSDPWLTPGSNMAGISANDSLFISSAFRVLKESVRSPDETAYVIIDGINKYQNKYASEILPESLKNKLEIYYEKFSLFSRLSLAYLFMSILIIMVIFLSVIWAGKFVRILITGLHYLLWVMFFVQLSGLGIRWYITGHAPLSNGYEAMLYVSLAGLLTGLLISYRNRLLLFVTSVFAAAPLFVAHLSLMNPELTNLVPVLKSYWLTIHVTVITTSYAVLGFAAFIALLNIFLVAYFNRNNKYDETINEFTFLNQTLVILGLYLLTIGSFLGGIWANESWGTYWSWDPKETWSLVSILIYSFVAHMKHIPSLRSRLSFNYATLLSYSSILMTYFGVNYFLGGMHSYGKGSAFELSYSTIIILIFLVFTLAFASYREKKMIKV